MDEGHMHTEDMSDSDTDSLFDEPAASHPACTNNKHGEISQYAPTADYDMPARRTLPPIRGLYFDPDVQLPKDLAEELMWTCIRAYFTDGSVNQVMLFERAPDMNERADILWDQIVDKQLPGSSHDELDTPSAPSSPRGGLPTFLCDLLHTLSELLLPVLPPKTHALLFPPPTAPIQARQAILNLYWPGEGITPHVDLLDRFGDGIIGVSLGSGCVMQFEKTGSDSAGAETGVPRRYGVYLPEGSILVMSDEARYLWTHGIEYRMEDLVEDDTGCCCCSRIEPRKMRLSITFRWLLPGADIVGGPTPAHT